MTKLTNLELLKESIRQDKVNKAELRYRFYLVHSRATELMNDVSMLPDDDQVNAFDEAVENLGVEFPEAEGLIWELADDEQGMTYMQEFFNIHTEMEVAFELYYQWRVEGIKVTHSYDIDYLPALDITIFYLMFRDKDDDLVHSLVSGFLYGQYDYKNPEVYEQLTKDFNNNL